MTENKEEIFQKKIDKLILFLSNQNVKFALLGDPTGETVLSGDLDLCAENINAFDVAIKNFCEKEKFILITKIYHDTGIRYNYAFIHNNRYIIFHGPDLLIFPTWHIKGCIGLSYKKLLQNSIKVYGKYYIPSVDDAFLFYFIKRIDKCDITEKQEAYLTKLFLKNSSSIEMRLNTFFSPKNVALISTAATTGYWKPVKDQMPQLAKELIARERISFSRWYWFSRRLVRRFFAPTGLFVVFLGPDGSGKSSVIDRVLSVATPPFTNTSYTHLRPRLGSKKRRGSVVTNPHDEPPRGVFASIIKLIYFFFDYEFGYLVRIKPLLIKSTLVVFDRYYYDLLIDPKRYRYSGSMWLARIVGKFIPKPDLVVLLDAPPEVLQARKQEVSLDESTRQRDAYLQFIQSLKIGVIIDASQPLEQVISDTNKEIFKVMSRKVIE